MAKITILFSFLLVAMIAASYVSFTNDSFSTDKVTVDSFTNTHYQIIKGDPSSVSKTPTTFKTSHGVIKAIFIK